MKLNALFSNEKSLVPDYKKKLFLLKLDMRRSTYYWNNVRVCVKLCKVETFQTNDKNAWTEKALILNLIKLICFHKIDIICLHRYRKYKTVYVTMNLIRFPNWYWVKNIIMLTKCTLRSSYRLEILSSTDSLQNIWKWNSLKSHWHDLNFVANLLLANTFIHW